VPADPNGVVLGIVQREDGRPHVAMLRKLVPLRDVAHLIPDTLLATDVLRLTAPCAGQRCRHFVDQRCSLASRVVATLPAVVHHPPACALRPTCRWWNQEGIAACQRCPQITTQPFEFSEEMAELATPRLEPSHLQRS
jgi:hypothetical protein